MRKISFLFLFGILFGEELKVDLRNPSYRNGTLFTEEGGVITSKEMRIQAKKMAYTKRRDIENVKAEGELLIQYKGRAYRGTSLNYNFLTKVGEIYDATTTAAMWFVSSDVITLKPDGSYKLGGVSITTCENKDSSWDLHAKAVNVIKKNYFEAKSMRWRLFKIPIGWLPSFKMSLKKFKEPTFRYTVNWDRGVGPRGSIRYQFYSWEDFAVYGRLAYRFATGWGGALETEYLPDHKRSTFLTRSFVGNDRLETAPDKMFRYRFQGAWKSKSENEKTDVTLRWDKYNDVRMPGVFKQEDFEVGTAKQTLLYIRHQEDAFLTSFKVRPRANRFESLKQDLPCGYAHIKPTNLANTGVYSFFSVKASYTDFAYSDDLVKSLSDFRSGRIEIKETLQKPIPIGPLTLTPFLGGHAIFYTNSQTHSGKKLGTMHYGLDLFARGERIFSHYKHVIEPYLGLSALTRPTVEPDDHYIFSLNDGIQKINQIQSGVRTLLFSKKRPGKEASFTADLFANAFFKDPTIPQLIPRMYLFLDWRLPSVLFSFHNAWNFRHDQVEFSNARFLWTANENVALSLEARYRSKYNWRKGNHDNFILDVSRSETELLLSPISDRRATLISSLFFRLNPLWETSISTISGFYREKETPYTEVKVDLSTWVSSLFKVRLSYSHVRTNDRVSFHVDMYKKN